MKQWQYKEVTVHRPTLPHDLTVEKQLNKFGNEGWELAAASYEQHVIKAIFKKEVFNGEGPYR